MAQTQPPTGPDLVTTVIRAACSSFELETLCTYPECKCTAAPGLCKAATLALLDAIRYPTLAMMEAGLVEFAEDAYTPALFVTAMWHAMVVACTKEIATPTNN